jgi:hypothetical protein
MDRKRVLPVVITAALLSLMVTIVTASSSISYTPLYSLRMEQASSEKNFLPTSINNFTYAAENGYTLNYDISEGCYGITPLIVTWQPTCEFYNTCETCSGGLNTCPNTCWDTCWVSC